MVRCTGEEVKMNEIKDNKIKYAENYMNAIHCINTVCERFVFALGRGECGM